MFKIHNKWVQIGNKTIGEDFSPFIVAEMSGNSNQHLPTAIQIINSAKYSGASALKIQTYDENTITLDCDLPDFIIKDKDSLWSNNKLYDLYKKAKTPRSFHKPVFDRCRELDLICFSSPFHESDVDFLEQEFNPPIYKIASFELNHSPLLAYVAKTKKPVILSTGMAHFREICDAKEILEENGCPLVILLKCTSTYPGDPKDSNLHSIPFLKQAFSDCLIGISDHTLGIGVSIGAVALGATVIEKHFTLNRSDGGIDGAFSMEPQELNQLVLEANRVKSSLGKVTLEPTESEKKSLQFRRSIYAVKDIKKGENYTENNIKVIRPGYGADPKFYNLFLKRIAHRDINRGEPINF